MCTSEGIWSAVEGIWSTLEGMANLLVQPKDIFSSLDCMDNVRHIPADLCRYVSGCKLVLQRLDGTYPSPKAACFAD